MYSPPERRRDRLDLRRPDGIRPTTSSPPARASGLRTVALVLLPFVVSGLVAVVAYFAPVAQVALLRTGQQLSSGVAAPPVAAGSPFTMLLMGSDDDAKFTGNPLTQSMILVRVDPAAKAVTMFSIPRDLYVPISGSRPAKIDQAYEVGGADTAVQTVEKDLDVRGLTLGTPSVLATGLPSAPAWSPDGKSLVYFAPSADRFQLFTVAIPGRGAPAPRAVTAGDAFDSTAPPAWYP